MEIAIVEMRDVRSGNIDVAVNLAKEDFHLRPFILEGISTERLLEIRSTFFSLLGVGTLKTRDIKVSPKEFDSIFTKNAMLFMPDLNPMDGFNRDVWSYLTLRVLPDLALWRWPNHAEERFIGGAERSCFQRLWQRAYVLGGTLASELQEDEAVNIFERPEALGGNRRLSLAFSEYIVFNRTVIEPHSGKKIITTEIVKQTAKRLRRSMSIRIVHTMSDSELETFIKTAFLDTFDSINKI